MKTARFVSFVLSVLCFASVTRANLIDLTREDDPALTPLALQTLLELSRSETEWDWNAFPEGLPPGLWMGPENDWFLPDPDCDPVALTIELLLDLDPLIDTPHFPEMDLGGFLEIVHGVFKDLQEPGSGRPSVPVGSAIPEPSTYGILGAVAMLGLILLRRIRESKIH